MPEALVPEGFEPKQSGKLRFSILQEDDTAVLKTAVPALGLRNLESFPVEHCANAYGLLLEAEAGWKLVFSGDTRPCSSLVRAAENATILIHEVIHVSSLDHGCHILKEAQQLSCCLAVRTIK